MKKYETEHYIFNFNEGSKADADIGQIAACQEACFQYICNVLKVKPEFKIEYILCDTPEAVGQAYGDTEPCNGFSLLPNTIYAVYNDHIQCIGFHEDAHVISYTINRPGSPAIREGLAMYFDRKWWGIHNMDWTGYYLKRNLYLPVDKLLDRDTFFDADCTITYPIMGAFTDYLISTYGIEAYMAFYRQRDMAQAMKEVFHKTPVEINHDFISYIHLFRLDAVVEERMASLLENYDN